MAVRAETSEEPIRGYRSDETSDHQRLDPSDHSRAKRKQAPASIARTRPCKFGCGTEIWFMGKRRVPMQKNARHFCEQGLEWFREKHDAHTPAERMDRKADAAERTERRADERRAPANPYLIPDEYD